MLINGPLPWVVAAVITIGSGSFISSSTKRATPCGGSSEQPQFAQQTYVSATSPYPSAKTGGGGGDPANGRGAVA
jgi:hypothetical protein